MSLNYILLLAVPKLRKQISQHFNAALAVRQIEQRGRDPSLGVSRKSGNACVGSEPPDILDTCARYQGGPTLRRQASARKW